MRRHSSLGFLAFALALAVAGFCLAETWSQGTLYMLWDTQPPATFTPGASVDASASAIYDPNFPEGTEWYWIDSTYTFSWTLSPDGSCTSTYNGNFTTVSGSFPDTEDPNGDRMVGVQVNLEGEIHLDDGEGGSTLVVDEGPIVIEMAGAAPFVQIKTAIAIGWTPDEGWPKCSIVTTGSAGPPGGKLTVSVLWGGEGQQHLTLPPKTGAPSITGSPGYNPCWAWSCGVYKSSDGSTTIGLNGNIMGNLVSGAVTVNATDTFFMVNKGQPPMPP